MSTAVDVKNGACARPLRSSQSLLEASVGGLRFAMYVQIPDDISPAILRLLSIAGQPQKLKDGK